MAGRLPKRPGVPALDINAVAAGAAGGAPAPAPAAGAGGAGAGVPNPGSTGDAPPPFSRLDSLDGMDEDDQGGDKKTDKKVDAKDAKDAKAGGAGGKVVQSGGKAANTPQETAEDTKAIQLAMEVGDLATVEKLMKKLRRAGIAANDLDAVLASTVGKKVELKDPNANGNRAWDFRHGKIPAGVNIIGEEPSTLEIQPDKSSALLLKPKSYMRCELKLPANGGGKLINDWSIVMDVKLDGPNLPKDGVALFQCNWGVRQLEGSAFLSKSGGLGTFGEYGLAKTWLKAGRWQRLVLTMGGSWGANRRLTTYVNAKQCATINKPVFQAVDGQMAVNPDSIVFFASTKEGLMPGLKVKYIEFRPTSMTPETVKEQATLNKIYSYWEVEKAAAEAKMHAGLSLAGLYKRPPPVWIHPAFLGEFGDAFLEGTGLEGGALHPGSAVLSLALERALQEQKQLLEGFDSADLQAMDTISELYKDLVDLCRKFALGSRSGAQLVFYMKHFRKRLESLKEGEFLIVPGGLGPHPLVYVLENQGKCYRFVICNSSPHQGLQWHPATAEQQPKIKYKTCMALDNISPARVLDDAFWAFLLKLVVYPAKQNTPDKIYDLLLPWLADRPLEQCMVDTANDATLEFRSPERAQLSFFRVLLESLHYLMRRKGLSPIKAKRMSFVLRVQYLALVDNDLRLVPSVSDNDTRLIKMACEQVAYSSVKLAKKMALSAGQLAAVKKVLDEIDDRVLALPCDDLNSTAPPPLLELDDDPDTAPKFDQWQLHPFFDRLQRKDDVDGLAGVPIRLPKYVPIDLLQLPKCVTNFEEALAAIRYCDKMCTLISVQSHCVKNTAFLKCALMEHTFTQVVPVPKPRTHPDYKDCVWAQPLRYALQLDILLLLQRVSEHWASSAFTLQTTRSFDAVKIILPGVFAAIADAVLRKKATDIPSEVSLHLMGFGGRGAPYGLSIGKFGDQSETIEVHTAELNIARTSVLDYFVDQQTQPDRQIFCWEMGNNFEGSTNALMGQICAELAFDQSSIHTYLSGEQYLIIKNYPEWALYRDVCFWFKYFCNCELAAFPPPNNYLQKHAELKWEAGEQGYIVKAFGNMPLFCRPTPPKPWTHRFPSTATPSFLTHPHTVKTEDDVLHIKNLPSFGDVMGQRDSELLISYLTVPYMRLPLSLTFFSTEDRIHCLKSKQLQDVLDSVLFEPGRYLLADMKQEPRDVPTTNPKLLATPYGMLLNELQRSPDGVIGSVLRLLKLALDLDTGTVKSSTVDIILYVIRVCARVDNYMSFLIEHTEKTHECINFALRDVVIYPRVLQSLKAGRGALRALLRGPVHRMLEAWCVEAMREIENKVSERIVDDNTKVACTLHAHLLILYRNVLPGDLTEENVSTLLSSFVFLTTRHTWNMLLSSVPETELFELLQVQRRKLIAWLHAAQQKTLDFCMESSVRVSTGTGIRVPRAADPNDVLNQWAYITGPRSVGRFTVLRSRRRAEDGKLDSKDDAKRVATVDDTNELGVEIDLQTIQLTLRSAHLKALDKSIAGHPDVRLIFGSENMQAATIESATNREWVRLVGRNHDIHYWKTPDPRSDVQVFDRDYVPGELEPTENWIIPIFEPVRLTYCMKPFPLQVCLPEKPLHADAQVAILVGIHPKLGGTWKEFMVFRQRRVVFCYDVMSHGRRFYRSLVYTSDTRFALRDMQPSPEARRFPWPVWERHGTGHPYASHPDPTSVVITRSKDLPSNLAGTEETFMPSRILAGLIPDALLDTHHFWQDQKDNLIGYPHDGAPHIIKVELVEMKAIDCTRDTGVCARIRRIPTIKPAAVAAGAGDAKDEKGAVAVVKAAGPRAKTIDEEELTLLNLMYAPRGTKLHSLAQVMSRVERLSYVLAWTKNAKVGVENENFSIDLVDLPRIKINFAAKKDEKGVTRLYSIDHVSLFVTNQRSELTTRLICGIPHSLLLANDNNEVQILVPSVHPARPPIGSAPFSTELVLYRTDAEWINTLDTRYYLYNVHVSLSFMFTPTLASALYLLLLRFLYRDYNEVFRLVNTIGTDTEFSAEENYIFQTLGSANNDCHPNAHACRLKISSVTIDSPVVPPWDLTIQMSRYITKLSHVSATCRMSHDEELQLLEQCICDVSDPRFDPKIYTEYEVTLIKNRKYYIHAYMELPPEQKGEKLPPKVSTNTFLPPRFTDSGWPYHQDISALSASAKDWINLTVDFSAPKLISGPTALDTIHAFWTGKENMTGSVLKLGFLFLYGLMTGTSKCKILGNDDSHTTASLLLMLCRDSRQRGMMQSILHLVRTNPYLCNKLPQFRDKRKYKNEKINGWADEKESSSPTAELFESLIPMLAMEISELHLPPDSYARLPPPRNTIAVVREGERDWVLPVLSDFACDNRTLNVINAKSLGLGQESLGLSAKELDAFGSSPLFAIGLDRYATLLTRAERKANAVSESLPFDVSAHSQAKSEVAKSMIARLHSDMKVFADAENKGKAPRIVGLLDADVSKFVALHSSAAPIAPADAKVTGERLTAAIKHLEALIETLSAIRDADNQYVLDAIPWITTHANGVRLPPVNAATKPAAAGASAGAAAAPAPASAGASAGAGAGDKKADVKADAAPAVSGADADALARYTFVLNRYCGADTVMWLDYLIGSLLSSKSIYDLQKLNPYFEPADIAKMFDVITGVILHANRVGQTNRSISDAKDVLALLRRCTSARPAAFATAGGDTNLNAGLIQKSESLAKNLTTKRWYVDEKPKPAEAAAAAADAKADAKAVVAAPAAGAAEAKAYDPRFLVFEFTWNIILRKMQVVLVRDFMNNFRTGRSTVKQMIMGQGKTTVVGPLLALMLGDGQRLVCQVVPPALLEFSRSVMRSTFSSIMHKRIYTLSFDRASKADPRIFKKLQNAVATRGVVISTPTSIKSMQLKWLELLHMIEDDSRPRTPALELDARELARSLRLFKDGILIMDEVDLILHPLKSELNFPIGAKHDLDFNPLRWKLPIHILDAIFYAERGRMSVGFKQSRRATDILARVKAVLERGYEERALQRSPHVILLNPDFYHKHLKPELIEWVALWLETQHISGIDEQQIRKYIRAGASGDSKEEEALAAAVEKNLSIKHKKLLNLSKDWLKSFLPHVLQKIDRVSFGILNAQDYERAMAVDPHMPRTRAKLAIPFVGKDVPSRSSEFAHPDVIIGLTILAYRYEGLRVTDFTDIIAALRTTLSKEIGPFNERKSALRYSGWVREAGGKIKGQVIYRDEAGGAGAKEMEIDAESAIDAKALDSKTPPPAAAAASAGAAAAAATPTKAATRKVGEAKADGRAPLPYELLEEERQEVVPLRLLKRSNEDQMNVLFRLLYKLPDLIHWYLTEFIFPAYMRHQIVKLSSSGQEVGGDALFGSRMGFSGTPSDLLPVELGKCGYEAGSDGQVIHTMTNPEVCSYQVVEEGWSVKSLLNRIARAGSVEGERGFHALIDTGALITGMTNQEVAQYLLDNGLAWCEGVVFLDELDRKMILIRATRRVLKLEQCGIAMDKRFAFYDQVHTTGMDIRHTLNACAVLTLGKDMVFRDYAQGAFRMRGIASGQTIHLFIIPEVQQLIARELKAAKVTTEAMGAAMAAAPAPAVIRKHLQDVSAWLVINSMRSERVQFNMLCVQNTSNVWRKHAYGELLRNHQKFNVRTKLDDPSLRGCNALFREPIDFSVEGSVPKPRIFSETIAKRIDDHKQYILTPQAWEVVNHVMTVIRGTVSLTRQQSNDELDEETALAFDREMVQEMEEEKERQQEQEQEQEIEIEKYVDLMYQRDAEEPTPWLFATLKCPTRDVAKDCPQFYPQNQFALYKRQPLKFAEYLYCSNNYFDKRWSGARRIKNVVMVMEWTPSSGALTLLPPGDAKAITADSKEGVALKKAFELFDTDKSGDIGAQGVAQVIKSAMDITPTPAEVDQVMREFGRPGKAGGEPRLGLQELSKFLVSGQFRREQSGRYFVAVSLAEAETIRRIMHIRLERPIIDGSDAHIALHCIPADNALIDVSHRFTLAPPYQGEVACQSFRFFDCDMYYKESALNVLLRALQRSGIRERARFFQQVIGCRRRGARKWEETPLAKVFTLPDEWHWLKQRAQSARTRQAIKEKGMLLYDAFRAFDSSRTGLLSPPELYGALEWLGLDTLTPADILDFVRTADTDRDGNISYKEFVEMLRDPQASLEDLEKEGESDESGGAAGAAKAAGAGGAKPLVVEKIAPKGAQELRELQAKLLAEEKAFEEDEKLREQVDELRIRRELSEEARLADEKQPGGPNPRVEVGRVRYDFSTGRVPRGVGAGGRAMYEYKSDVGRKHVVVGPGSVLYMPTHFKSNGGGNAAHLNQFTVTVEVKFAQLPQHPATQFGLLQFPKSAITIGGDMPPLPAAAGAAGAAGAGAAAGAAAAGDKKAGVVDSKAAGAAAGGIVYVRNDGGVGFDGTYGYDRSLYLSSNRWAVLSIAVDTVKGELTVFVNGKTLCAVRNAATRQKDGPFSLAGTLALFGATGNGAAREQAEQGGGCVRFVLLETKCLAAADARALYEAIAAEGAWTCAACTMRNAASAMACGECGTKRPIELSAVGGWVCKGCTFANTQPRDDCEVCGTPKDGDH